MPPQRHGKSVRPTPMMSQSPPHHQVYIHIEEAIWPMDARQEAIQLKLFSLLLANCYLWAALCFYGDLLDTMPYPLFTTQVSYTKVTTFAVSLTGPFFSEDYSKLGTVPHRIAKEEPLEIAGARIFYRSEALPVTQPKMSNWKRISINKLNCSFHARHQLTLHSLLVSSQEQHLHQLPEVLHIFLLA